MNLDYFTQSYIEAALWATTDESNEQGGEPLDANYGVGDLAPEALDKIIADCARFQEENAADLYLDSSEQGGHDFFLTRNHHGAGFWDGDWPDDVGQRLTVAAHAYEEDYLYVGDDGKIYN